jgi:hypothetical protein
MRAVATPDLQRVTANEVANRSAETSAGACSCLHAREGYATLPEPQAGDSAETAHMRRRRDQLAQAACDSPGPRLT